MTTSLDTLLARGLAAQGLECDQSIQRKLIAFVDLLKKWNKVYNLTAITDPQQSLIRHILDSLSVVRFIQGPAVLDVGAGAGLPGLPLALCLPSLQFVECESSSKKTRFIQQAIIDLGLTNVGVEACRVEELWQHHLPESVTQYDSIISRAFSSIADMISKAGPLCREGGKILAMKGQVPEQELTQIPVAFRVQAVEKLEVYGLNEQRTLVILSKQASA